MKNDVAKANFAKEMQKAQEAMVRLAQGIDNAAATTAYRRAVIRARSALYLSVKRGHMENDEAVALWSTWDVLGPDGKLPILNGYLRDNVTFVTFDR